jgi:hypothetical protein
MPINVASAAAAAAAAAIVLLLAFEQCWTILHQSGRHGSSAASFF